MNKFISILLILCLCSTWLGYHLLFHFQLSAVKSEMKAFLANQKNHKDVIELSFSGKELEQLEWEEEMEFNYKGEMYDVLDKQVEGNHVTVRCIADTKEDSLLLDYQKNTGRNSSSSLMGQLITTPFILPFDNLLKLPACVGKNAFPEVSINFPTTISTVPSPPPDVC